MRRRVVVTGLGAVTPVGNDVATTWQSLLAGVSGGAPITKFDASAFKVHFACEVKGFDVGLYMDRKEAKRADLYTQYAMAASVQAMQDAGLASGDFVPEDCGVIIGSGIGGLATMEEQHSVLINSGNRRISPFFVPMYIVDIAAGVVSMRFGAKGPNYATVSACSTSAHAIGEAFRTIVYGDADVMITGGSEASVLPMAIGGFGNMTALSERNDSPATASRPFDATRDGFVLGEGAGVVVLEELEHARRRGARIYGEVIGYGATGDAYSLTGQPDAHEGLQRAMRKAIKDGGFDLTEVDYINAHGTSTPLNDANEIKAIKSVFGEHAKALSVSSTKSATGHLLGAAGGVEFIACALAVRDGMIPPTINHATPDPECDLDVTPNTPKARPVRIAMSNSSGFGGHNVSIAIRRFTE
ncbi:3-oxoacyl-[acyl-carrier-protein] synthase II [Gemmatimonas aurantiaca T-27]|uniref:3-oxoacyl-[acyl-carrier-protein] synthase 2 n=1 Tax=Gemmatimonas aurantiaca (strain DSM 14586 / JCM 11422 / NBRC 100505 / T-27) TaxID=379066 RepID=C1A8W7_GEMAT|nr:beta-ketoacyl-ACP synthase II [Gemmatimonas aurantiaca]BAH38677.1 3-oxoacyl-[acyl-carrier-protein] synthase II [Gemmatimonas aurantiaca T-27]